MRQILLGQGQQLLRFLHVGELKPQPASTPNLVHMLTMAHNNFQVLHTSS